MELDKKILEIMEFINSTKCRVSTGLNESIVNATNFSRDAFKPSPDIGRYSPLHETPGGRAVTTLINGDNFTRLQEERIWQALEQRYIKEARGDLRILSEPGALPKATFQNQMLQAIFTNPLIKSLNGVAIDYFRPLYKEEQGLDKRLTAQTILGAGSANVNEFVQKAHDVLPRKVEDQEKKAILLAVETLAFPKLIPQLDSYRASQAKLVGADNKLVAHEANYQARIFFKSSPFVFLPYLLRRAKYGRLLRDATKETDKAQLAFDTVAKELRSTPFVKSLNAEVNEQLRRLGAPELVVALTPAREERILKSIEQAINQKLIENPSMPSVMQPMAPKRGKPSR